MKDRDLTFDIMKGIAIILVVCNHFLNLKLISIFHMPLWYFVSGYFFSQKPIYKSLKKDFVAFVIPYYITGCLILTLIYFIWGSAKATVFAEELFWGIVKINNLNISIGPIWFLLSFFICKNIYNFLSYYFSHYIQLFMALSISTLYVLFLSDKTEYIPLYLSTVAFGNIFYSLGVIWKEKNKNFFLSNKFTPPFLFKFNRNHIMYSIDIFPIKA